MSSSLYTAGALGLAASPLLSGFDPSILAAIGALPAFTFLNQGQTIARQMWLERERADEGRFRGGRDVLGAPPQRDCFQEALEGARAKGKNMIDRYLVGFELDTGAPLWIDDDDLCSHACVFAKTGVGKTLWLESLMFQQMARGRASGLYLY